MDCFTCAYGQQARAAAYLWTAASTGDEIPVCAECCAYWRSLVRDDPDLQPARIRTLEAAP